MVLRAALLATALVGCGEVASLPPDSTAESCVPDEFIDCAGDAARRCNATGDGTIDEACGVASCNAAAGRCNACVPAAPMCSVGAIAQCGADGLPLAAVATEACAVGCVDPKPGIPAHCAYIEPTYPALANACDVPASSDLAIASDTNVDTTTDDFACTGGIVPQPNGMAICVVRHRTITIASGKRLVVKGNRLLALISDDALTISGTLDASANATVDGPGGGFYRSGGAATSGNGGGGAGFKTAGGAGGSEGSNGGAANGGMGVSNPITLTMTGGSRGVTATTSPVAKSGGAGGGVILISCRGQVSVPGTVDVSGGGGEAGRDVTLGVGKSFIAGGGGGSGGYLVIQGVAVVVTGSVYSNGGAGGGGCGVDDGTGAAGADGSPTATAASGGVPTGTAGGGGDGGYVTSGPQVGDKPTGFPASAGGGGGSAGFLQTYTPSSVTPVLAPSTASPNFQSNRVVPTR